MSNISINCLSLIVNLLPKPENGLNLEKLNRYFTNEDYVKTTQCLSLNDGCKLKLFRSGCLTVFFSSHIQLYIENFKIVSDKILEICNLLCEDNLCETSSSLFNIHTSGQLKRVLRFKDIFNSEICKDFKKRLQVSRNESGIEIDSWKEHYTGCCLLIDIGQSCIIKIFNSVNGLPPTFVGILRTLDGFHKHLEVIERL